MKGGIAPQCVVVVFKRGECVAAMVVGDHGLPADSIKLAAELEDKAAERGLTLEVVPVVTVDGRRSALGLFVEVTS